MLAFATNSSQSIFDMRKRRREFKPIVECDSEGYRKCRLGLVGFNRFGAECEKIDLSRLLLLWVSEGFSARPNPRRILVGFRVKIKQTCSRELCSSLKSVRVDLSIDVSKRRSMLLKVSFEMMRVTEEGRGRM